MLKSLNYTQIKHAIDNKRCQCFIGFFVVFLLIVAFCFLLTSNSARASRVDELKADIVEQNNQITEIEKEIEKYQKQINETLEEKTSLKNEINRLEIAKKKLQSSIYLIERKILSANSNIERLAIEISEKEKGINKRKETLAEIIRNVNEEETQTLVEIILGHENFSDFFGDLEKMNNFQKQINVNLAELKDLKNKREEEKTEERVVKNSLENYKTDLIDQKYLTNLNKNKKNNLLTQTQNKESNYRKLLEEKQEQKEIFERELLALEATLQIEIDPTKLPDSQTGILGWPVNEPFITQYFGNTKFATQNPQIYNGKGHTGVDFRAPTGEKIKASLGGTVTDVGNTDQIIKGSKVKVTFKRVNVRKSPNGSIIGKQSRGRIGTIVSGPINKGSYTWWKVNFSTGVDGWVASVAINSTCYSFGKWILIKHPNGLSTLSAHLSLIKVSKGQNIKAGQTIGYSGSTGYATGPHLHFGVYATQGVQVTRFVNSINCKNTYVPIADKKAYLNPLSYLPKI